MAPVWERLFHSEQANRMRPKRQFPLPAMDRSNDAGVIVYRGADTIMIFSIRIPMHF